MSQRIPNRLSMKKLIIISFVILLAALTALLLLFLDEIQQRLVDLLFGAPTEIKDGFTTKLRNALKDQYGITVPEDAVFIKGYNTNSFRDPSVIVLFECPLNHLENTGFSLKEVLSLDDSWNAAIPSSDTEEHNEFIKETGGKLDFRISNNSIPFTYLSYEHVNGNVLVRFRGHVPHNVFS